MYGQPHQNYGMSSQSSYEHSTSPANVGGFAQSSQHDRDGVAGGAAAVGAYGRSGSTQAAPSQAHSSGSGAFAGVPDVFGRSGAQNQSMQFGQHQAHPHTGADEGVKSYGDGAKVTGGPSPLMPGRPGSANNTTSGQGQSQAQSQSGFAGYPTHLNQHLPGNQGGQYGGLAGVGSHQAGVQNHQGAGYGGQYGSQYGSYYGNSGRGGNAGSTGGAGGWGGNYGH